MIYVIKLSMNMNKSPNLYEVYHYIYIIIYKAISHPEQRRVCLLSVYIYIYINIVCVCAIFIKY